MSNNGTNKRLRIYLSVLFVLHVIQWFWLVRHEYLWTVCQYSLEKSANVMAIWAQLTPVSKLLTIIVIYITFHVIIVAVKRFIILKKQKGS